MLSIWNFPNFIPYIISFIFVETLAQFAEAVEYTCCIVTTIFNYTYIHAETKSTIMTNEHTSLEKYTFHFIRKGCERVAQGLCVKGELKTEQTPTYWPQVPLTLAVLLSHSTGLLNRGPWGPNPLLGPGSLYSILSSTNWTCLWHRVI